MNGTVIFSLFLAIVFIAAYFGIAIYADEYDDWDFLDWMFAHFIIRLFGALLAISVASILTGIILGLLKIVK